MAVPTVDDFQALARSSSRRWRTLHFRHREDGAEVEAWLRRPSDLIVLTDDGRRHRIHEEPRSEGWLDEHDDPMWVNYHWVALLNPVELSHHVDVRHLRVDSVAGRPVWRAELRAVAGYEPRCGGHCCELLVSEAGWYSDHGGLDDPDPDAPQVPDGLRFPECYDVALDAQTGVVVRLLPIGSDRYSATEVDILEVDADLDALFA